MKESRSVIQTFNLQLNNPAAIGRIVNEILRIPKDIEVFRISIQAAVYGGFPMVLASIPPFLLVSNTPPTNSLTGYRLYPEIKTNAAAAAAGSYLTESKTLVLDRRGMNTTAVDNLYLAAFGNADSLRAGQTFVANVIMEGYNT